MRGHGVDDARAIPATPANPGVRRLRRAGVIAAAMVGVAAIAVIGFNMGGTTGVPGVAGSPEPAAASPAIDTAKVGDLMQKIQADPKDISSLQALADIYYAGNQFETAAGFLRKIIAIDAGNVTARLALGAATFNVGQPTEAEAQWREVLKTDPNNLEAHYDLGFMYLSRDPADLASAKVEWTKVIAIAPDSDVAKSVRQHLASLDGSPAPGSSGAGASPSPAETAAATAAPSPAGAPAPSGR